MWREKKDSSPGYDAPERVLLRCHCMWAYERTAHSDIQLQPQDSTDSRKKEIVFLLPLTLGPSHYLRVCSMGRMRDSSWYGNWPTDWTTDKTWFDSQQGEEIFLLNAHIGYGVQPASYLVGNGDPFLGCKAAGEWSWPLTSIYQS
jgi:hypothetical protein